MRALARAQSDRIGIALQYGAQYHPSSRFFNVDMWVVAEDFVKDAHADRVDTMICGMRNVWRSEIASSSATPCRELLSRVPYSRLRQASYPRNFSDIGIFL